jgi:hypothetical protein
MHGRSVETIISGGAFWAIMMANYTLELLNMVAGILRNLETIVATILCGRSMVLLGRVDAGTTPAATNSQWVFQTSVDVTLLLLLCRTYTSVQN